MGSGKVILKTERINKASPGVKALTDIDFELKSGGVHVLLEKKGAGKSTLISVKQRNKYNNNF